MGDIRKGLQGAAGRAGPGLGFPRLTGVVAQSSFEARPDVFWLNDLKR